MKKVKFIKDGKIEEGRLIDDKYFVGGKKIEFKEKNGTKGFYCVGLVTILEDEYTGSTRN
jgi:hypothetical protein